MFEGFTLETVELDEVTLRVRHGGSGPPLLLLHGHPQTHVMWHLVAPQLADFFTVVCPDLRGYGDSSKPPSTSEHDNYSKRTMANDFVRLMRDMGHERFAIAGHDRGARVAYRLALDHCECVTKLALLDIIPTGEVWRRMDADFALDWWHWAFLAQPHPLPETLLAANPDAYYLREGRELFYPEALEDYLRCIHNPETIRAMCEDYRAGASVDRALDNADYGERRIVCPLLVLWSAKEAQWARLDMLEVWQKWAEDVRGYPVDASHYLAEEMPDEIASQFLKFFGDFIDTEA